MSGLGVYIGLHGALVWWFSSLMLMGCFGVVFAVIHLQFFVRSDQLFPEHHQLNPAKFNRCLSWLC